MNERQRRQRERCQREQARAPRWFHFQVAAMAVAGEFLFQLALVLPIALVLVIGALFMNRVVIWWAVLIAIPFFWWLLQPTLHVPGRPLRRMDAPGLYAMVDELARLERSPRIAAIHVDDSFNAGALELGRGWLPWRVRRVLILGGPLLATLPAAGVRAVIAHELGHFSREHGRLGHWIYRARQGWQAAASAGKDDSFLDQAAGAFARWFEARFEVRASVHSRVCEYEADATAARAVGAGVLAASLAETHWCAEQWFHGEGQRALERLNHDHPHPPPDLWQSVAQAIRERPAALSWLDMAWAEQTTWADTHPALRERVAALGVQRAELEHHLAGLGRAQASSPDLQKALAEPLGPADSFHWALAHARLRHGAEAALLRGQPDGARSLESARQLAEAGQGAEALATLERLIASDASWAAPARLAIARLPRTVVGEDEASRNAALLERAWARRAEAASAAAEEILAGRAALAAPHQAVTTALAACLATQQAIVSARMALTTATVDGRLFDVAVVGLRMDPAQLAAARINEDEAARIVQDQAECLLPPNTVVTVHRGYSTESEPRWHRSLFPLAAAATT